MSEKITVWGLAQEADRLVLVHCGAVEDSFSFMLDDWQPWARGCMIVPKNYDEAPLLQKINVHPDPIVVLERAVQYQKDRIEDLTGLIQDHRRRVLELEVMLAEMTVGEKI